MEKNYSKSEILKFLYGELDPQTEKEFIEELYTNEELFHEFEALQEAQAALNQVEISFQPSEHSVKTILAHVEQTSPVQEPVFLKKMAAAIPGFKYLATGAMVTFSLVILAVFFFAYQKANAPLASDPEKVLSWEAPAIHQRIDQVRMNLGNMSGERHLPVHLNQNTYRIINTAEFDSQPANVVLVNLK